MNLKARRLTIRYCNDLRSKAANFYVDKIKAAQRMAADHSGNYLNVQRLVEHADARIL